MMHILWNLATVGLAPELTGLLMKGGQAYLDPGSGSFILQLLIAALFGALFLVKVYWGKIKAFFGRMGSSKDTKQQDE
jgi:hypothetical protein